MQADYEPIKEAHGNQVSACSRMRPGHDSPAILPSAHTPTDKHVIIVQIGRLCASGFPPWAVPCAYCAPRRQGS